MPLDYDIDSSCQIPRNVLIALYEKYFSNKTDGTYVEVGAYDGVRFGVVSALAKLGWRGLCIEAHPEFADQCRKNHAGNNVFVETCAVGAVAGEATLYVATHEKGAVSSTQWTPASRSYGLDVNKAIKVPMYQLDTILQRNNIRPGFELLSVDVEEAEMEVLAGFNVRYWMPSMVIIETHEKDPNFIRSWKAAPISAYFRAVGYEKIYSDHINSVFLTVKYQ